MEAVPTTITTQVGVAPSLPAQIKVLYADGVYEMTNVTWKPWILNCTRRCPSLRLRARSTKQ
ncbi:MAG: Ig-like domain-containing protein [Hungatella hathewayi]